MTLVLGVWMASTSAQVPMPAEGLSTSAEYIVGFVRHVRWSDEERLPAWRVCIVGELPREQERAYAGRIVRGKPFAVLHLETDDPLGDCQVLDLTTVSSTRAQQVLSQVRGQPILAVGTGAEFCSAGGQICLHFASDGAQSRRKFEVNLSTIKESKLQASARLLTVGTVRAGSEEPR
ncbi:MAG TPA: YfiR family protein [Fontimonas sp.]